MKNKIREIIKEELNELTSQHHLHVLSASKVSAENKEIIRDVLKMISQKYNVSIQSAAFVLEQIMKRLSN